MNKKLQIFVSSTYTDLKNERQLAVKSILESGHIPAGMELFTANSSSQWEIIKKWIDNSDVYLLILGGRYGTLDAESGKSYTEMEYDYAEKMKKPIITIILSERYLNATSDEAIKVKFETAIPNYIQFRERVYNKIAKIIDEIYEIDNIIPKAILELEKNEMIQLTGWIRGDFSSIVQKFKIGELSYNELHYTLTKKTFTIPKQLVGKYNEEISGLDALELLSEMGGQVASKYAAPNEWFEEIYNNICTYFISLGLLETKKVTGKHYYSTNFTRNGIKFNQLVSKFNETNKI